MNSPDVPQYISKPPDEEKPKANPSRRKLLQSLSLLNVGAMSVLSGCSSLTGGGDEPSGDDDLMEVPTIQVLGETPDQGVVYEVLRETVNVWEEELPFFDFEFTPMEHTQVIERGYFEKVAMIPSFRFGQDLRRLEPQALLWDPFHSSNRGCATHNFTDYADSELDQLLEAQRQEYDFEERVDLIHEIQERLGSVGGEVEFGSIRPIIHPVIIQMYNSELFGGIESSVVGLNNVLTFNNIQPETDESTMLVPFEAGTSNISPLLAEDLNVTTIRHTFDTLITVDHSGEETIPWLAEDWEIVDDTTIEFVIRDDHSFHDGEPVTAEDVAFTYEYMQEYSPNWEPIVSGIESSEMVDEYTVRFNLEFPDAPGLVVTFAQVPILPKHIWESIPQDVDAEEAIQWSPTGDELLIGSGHFTFSHWRKGEEVMIEANENHFSPPNIDAAIFRIMQTDTANQSLISGDAHMLFDSRSRPTTLVEMAEENDHLEHLEVLSLGNEPLVMNTWAPPFGFEEVRAALESAIPKRVIAEEIWQGFAEVGHGMVSPVLEQFYNENQPKWGLSFSGSEKSVELLEDAGFVIQDDTIYFPPGEEPDMLEPVNCEDRNYDSDERPY